MSMQVETESPVLQLLLCVQDIVNTNCDGEHKQRTHAEIRRWDRASRRGVSSCANRGYVMQGRAQPVFKLSSQFRQKSEYLITHCRNLSGFIGSPV